MRENIDFIISGLAIEDFERYFKMSDEELAAYNARRLEVTKNPGFPCRVSLEDAKVGEKVILLPFLHQDTQGPYRSMGAIFVRQNATPAAIEPNQIPHMLNHRLLSVRGYDHAGLMRDAVVVKGDQLASKIQDLLENSSIKYLHIHNAGPGCFNCRVDRR